MPAATSSRRVQKGLRRDPSDVIEEDGPSQRRLTQREDIEEEDDPVLVRRIPKGKKKAVPARVEEEEEDDNDEAAEVEDDGDDPLAALGEPPLDTTQAVKIHGVAEDWRHVRQGNHVMWYTLVKDVGGAIAEFAEGEKGEKMVAGVDNLMKGLLDAERELLAHEEALVEMQQKVARGEPVTDVISLYDAGVESRMEEYKQKTTRQKYGKSDQYTSFQQAIFEVQHPGEAMPPVTNFIPKELGDDSDDEDIEIGGISQVYKCPLTLTILVDPLTSKLCGHSFSAEAIRSYLGNGRKECPTAGCNKMIKFADLQENKELRKKAENAARRERMREEDDEDDYDVVE